MTSGIRRASRTMELLVEAEKGVCYYLRAKPNQHAVERRSTPTGETQTSAPER